MYRDAEKKRKQPNQAEAHLGGIGDVLVEFTLSS